MLGLSLGVAVAYNAVSKNPLPWIAVEPEYKTGDISALVGGNKNGGSPAPEAPSGELTQISLEQARQLYDSGKAIFLDARTEAEFAEGHIKGALSMPYEQRDEHADLLPGLEGKAIVTYCGGKECKASIHLAEHLREFDFSPIFIFFGGWPEWQKAGYPVEP